ncbi:hypothetical protein ACET3Z_019552 [Daucus carota]
MTRSGLYICNREQYIKAEARACDLQIVLSSQVIYGMAGGNLLHRAISYVINQFVVEGLANSRTFQRFAVRTEKQLQELSEKAVEKRREVVEMMKDISKGSQPPTR